MTESKGLDVKALQAFFAEEFPQSSATMDSVEPGKARMRQLIANEHLRPGRTVSGPTMMALADATTYAAILGSLGRVALAVTTNLSIAFLRKPAADRDVIAEATLLKLGSRLAVADVRIWSEGDERPVAQATVTYALPPS
jgi:uncharacterized protein (TIGR00369 family)